LFCYYILIDFISLKEHLLLLYNYQKFKIMKSIVLESAKGVKGGKIQLCFSQIVDLGKAPTNLLGMLNESDDRFNQPKPRFAWLSGEASDIKKHFGLDLNLAEGEELTIGAIDPRVAGDDRPLNIQINETTEGSNYDVENFETRAKRAGKDGDFIMHNGMYIYVRTSVVVGDPKHVTYENTTRKPVSGTASDAIADALNG